MSDQVAARQDSIDNSGIKIFYRSWHPKTVKACLVVVHGEGDHSARYAHVGEFFSQKDFAVYAMDLRGQGVSGGTRGHVDDFDEYIADVSLVVEKARNEYPNTPLFVLGHSMGGTISALYGISQPGKVQGILLSSPCMGFKMKVNPVKKWFSRVIGKVFPMISFSDGIDPSWVSTNQEVVQKYAADDVRCGTITAGWYNALESAIVEAMARAGNLSAPCMIMQAGDDLLVEPERSREFYEKIGSEDKDFRLYEGCYHEIVNEPQQEEILQDIWEWIANRLN
ncbi:MAG: lysophospholipase [Ignavibacteriales bacterium]